jgi:hypothetical protein
MSKIYLPLLSDRQSSFRAIAYDRLNTTGSIFVYCKSIHNDLEYQKKINFTVPVDPDLVQIDYKFFIV